MDTHTDVANGAAGTDPAAPKLEITTSRQFVSWLAESGGSLAFTTYQSGKVFLIGSNRHQKKLSIFERTLERPMGMAVSGSRLAIAAMTQITTFVDAAEGAPTRDAYDAVFVPQMAHFTGDLDIHDIAFDEGGASSLPIRCSPASPRSARPTASGRCGGRPTSRGSRSKTAATSTDLRCLVARPPM